MDDIKLFASNESCLKQLVDKVRDFPDNIKISFAIGNEKCAKLSAWKGKPVSTDPLLYLRDKIDKLSLRVPRIWKC